ncbi:unnamed protein product [Caenorhabditis auriculariae]|uniref:Uncharacterized protein n=1 Tax=Caenorhabditis auriculariae TaxID=2777116 RepID=A0A8S1H6F5_9PELO|nr:unnamed protein product [Caenorhabditis auriculariae]
MSRPDSQPRLGEGSTMPPRYLMPVPEPPVDYTIRVKPSSKDYRHVGNIYRRDPPPDYTNEKPQLSNQRVRRDTVVESEEILNELDNVLQNAAIPFHELKQKVESFNLTFKPYASREEAEEATSSRASTYSGSSLDRAKAQSVNRNSPARVPILENEIVEDLKSVTVGSNVQNVNKNREKSIEEMYENTKRLIASSKVHFSPEFFYPQFSKPGVPEWKMKLLAEKKSKEKLHEIEKSAWREFETWKQKLAPKAQVRPEYEFAKPAALRR